MAMREIRPNKEFGIENYRNNKRSCRFKKIIKSLIFIIFLAFLFNTLSKTRFYKEVKEYIKDNTNFGKVKYLASLKVLDSETLKSSEEYGEIEDIDIIDSIDNGYLRLVNNNYDTFVEKRDNLVSYDDGYLMRREVLDNYLKLKEELWKKRKIIYIISAYRDEFLQEEIYERENDKSYVALPYFSEHHTGLALDIYPGNGKRSVDEEIYDNLKDLAPKYGFILRYPKGKEKITGISFEKWHFRYVGIPHSFIMHDLDLTLKEYLTYLEENPIVDINTKVGSYRVYYQSGDSFKVPTLNNYIVSRNNIEGFIVTEKRR